MKKYNYLIYFALVVVIVFLIFNRNEILDRPSTQIITSDTVIIPGDERFTEVWKIQKVPTPVYVYLPDTTLSEIDSLAIVKDYFSKRQYSDTLSGQEVDVVINEEIYQNRINNREFFIKNNRSSSIITNTITTTLTEKPRIKLFLGGGISASPDRFGFNLGAMVLNKRENLFGLSFDPLNTQINFNAYIKIRLRDGSKKTTKE